MRVSNGAALRSIMPFVPPAVLQPAGAPPTIPLAMLGSSKLGLTISIGGEDLVETRSLGRREIAHLTAWPGGGGDDDHESCDDERA